MGKLALVVVAILGAAVVILAQAHTHSHSHQAEPAHYKYSKEANEDAAREVHSHAHDAHHGHSHGDHGHSHDHHGHSHEEAHGHSHGEGGCPYAHGHVDDDEEEGYYYGEDEDEFHHGHSHDEHHGHSHGEDHGHSHGEDHGHSHDEDHGHSHGEAHGHSHDKHQGHAHSEHEHGHSHSTPTKKPKAAETPSAKSLYDPKGPLAFLNNMRTRLWVYGMGSTLLISIAPFVILFVIPIQANTAENAPLLKVLLAFGSGGLLGDAFLHLIPHAQPAGEGHAHSHSHSHLEGHAHAPHDMQVGGCVLAGIIAFLAVEKIVRIFRDEEGHSHSHSHAGDAASSSKKEVKKKVEKRVKGPKKEKKSDVSSAEESSHDDHEEDTEEAQLIAETPHTGFKVAAYLNLAADFAHNFTDGLAIGASYLAGSTIGFVTMITVLVHEVPHEIGDFAILVQSGFSKRRAMCVQLLTALGALSGCAISLWTAEAYGGDLSDATTTSMVLSFTAGGFIYIALVSVIPELLENSSLWQSIKETFAMALGIFLMYLIGLYE